MTNREGSCWIVDWCWSPAGLQILYTLLQNVSSEEAAAQSFYQTYFCDILQHIFSVVTDTSHTAGKRRKFGSKSRITSVLWKPLDRTDQNLNCAPCLQV